jgi:N-methylhydantoinase A
VRPLAATVASERDALLDELRTEGVRVLNSAGVRAEEIRFRYGLDARYLGQGNEITLWVGEGDTWPVTDAQVLEQFESEYRRIYGLTIPDVGIEAVTWRLSAYAPASSVEPSATVGTGEGALHSRRLARFSRAGQQIETPVYRRTELGVGQTLTGPAIIEERETTAVIRPGWTVTVAGDGSLIAEWSAA